MKKLILIAVMAMVSSGVFAEENKEINNDFKRTKEIQNQITSFNLKSFDTKQKIGIQKNVECYNVPLTIQTNCTTLEVKGFQICQFPDIMHYIEYAWAMANIMSVSCQLQQLASQF